MDKEKTLNIEAREELLREINNRMTLIKHVLDAKIMLALGKTGFARNSVLTEPMNQVEKFLREGSKLLMESAQNLKYDGTKLYDLADQARKINKEEVE